MNPLIQSIREMASFYARENLKKQLEGKSIEDHLKELETPSGARVESLREGLKLIEDPEFELDSQIAYFLTTVATGIHTTVYVRGTSGKITRSSLPIEDSNVPANALILYTRGQFHVLSPI